MKKEWQTCSYLQISQFKMFFVFEDVYSTNCDIIYLTLCVACTSCTKTIDIAYIVHNSFLQNLFQESASSSSLIKVNVIVKHLYRITQLCSKADRQLWCCGNCHVGHFSPGLLRACCLQKEGERVQKALVGLPFAKAV